MSSVKWGMPKRRTRIPTREVENFLRDIERGAIALRKLNPGSSVYVHYEASNGWELVIFNDAGCFDWVAHVESPDGRSADSEQLYGQKERLSYEPSYEAQGEIYGIKQYFESDPDFELQGNLFHVDSALPIDITQILTIDDQIKAYFARHPEQLYQLSPRRFEELVAAVLRDFGFDCELTPPTRDGGCDIYAHVRNKITTFLMYVECKRYDATRKIGIDIVQRVHGAANAAGAHKGMIVTTSFFTTPALQEQRRIYTSMDLIDFDVLRSWFKTCWVK